MAQTPDHAAPDQKTADLTTPEQKMYALLAAKFRERAVRLAPGPEQERLFNIARQLEAFARAAAWAHSSGLRTPSER